jgi:hypothetical protein
LKSARSFSRYLSSIVLLLSLSLLLALPSNSTADDNEKVPPCYTRGADFCVSDNVNYSGPDQYKGEAESLAHGAQSLFENAFINKRRGDDFEKLDTIYFEDQVQRNIDRGLDQRWWRPTMSTEVKADDSGAMKTRSVWNLDNREVSSTDWIDVPKNSGSDSQNGSSEEDLVRNGVAKEEREHDVAKAIWDSYQSKNRRDIIDDHNDNQLGAIEDALKAEGHSEGEISDFRKNWEDYTSSDKKAESEKGSASSLDDYVGEDHRIPSDQEGRQAWRDSQVKSGVTDLTNQEKEIARAAEEERKNGLGENTASASSGTDSASSTEGAAAESPESVDDIFDTSLGY